MANCTQKLIIETFENMLERMPLEKITVTALIKECNIGRNTFYYHYEDIYALLDDALLKALGQYENDITDGDWKGVMKSLLYACRHNKKKVYHIYQSLSRDRLERYLFSKTDNSIYNYIRRIAETRNVDPARTEIVANIVKYSVVGFILQFFWNDMNDDIDEKVDRSGAYMARYLAKNIVAQGLAEQCEVQLSYAIGLADPMSVRVDTFGTGKLDDSRICEALIEKTDLRPAAIIDQFNLTSPHFSNVSCYGHFGSNASDMPWEKTDLIQLIGESE